MSNDQLTNPSLSPTGVRALFEARGEVFTIPVEKGDWRNLTRSPGAADRNPIWSPDGKSDRLVLRRERRVSADDRNPRRPRASRAKSSWTSPTFYFTPAWSPDGK